MSRRADRGRPGKEAKPQVLLELLVEEESAYEALKPLLPKLFTGHQRQCPRIGIRQFRGKPDLLKQLPKRLSGYAAARRRGDDVRVVVLLDRDSDDCVALKKQLDAMAHHAGLVPRSRRDARGDFHVLNRIAIRELESWYFGDWDAVRAAFPRITPDIPGPYRGNPDLANGKCSHAFEKVLRASGVRMSSKPEWARRIGPHLGADTNRSPSFRSFVTGVRALVDQ